MPNTFITRLGAIAVVGAIAAAGVLVTAAPASAAGASIILANDTFTENNWGEGISLTGSGFLNSENDLAEINVGTLNAGVFVAWTPTGETVPIASDGTLSLDNWMPSQLPQIPIAGFDPVVQVSYDLCSGTSCEFSEEAFVYADIVIVPFVAGDPGITITPGCNTVEQIQTQGYTVVVTGLDQFETVADTVTGPDGEQFGDVTDLQADATGTATGQFTLSGDIQLGIYTENILRLEEGVGVPYISGTFEVGTCGAPTPTPTPTTPAVVVPAAPKLAETGSSDGGLLAGGALTFLLAGAVLMLVRRRATA